MKHHHFSLLAIGLLLVLLAACGAPAPAPLPPTAAVPTAIPTAPPAPPTTVAPTAVPAAPTPAPPTATVAPTAVPGLNAADVEKLVNGKLNTLDTKLALWTIQPGLGTVMIEYGNRLARLWYAANAGNWDMAKYQLDEMTEIQEVGETTRPGRAPMLKAFEESFLAKIDKAIAAKDKTVFVASFNDAVKGCNACHAASTGSTWKSYQYVMVQTPKTDPATYIDWKGGGQDSYIANPPPAATAAPTSQGQAAAVATLDAAGIQKLINGKLDKVDRSLTLWNIQPGLGTVMIEYGNRFSRLNYSAKAGNWDMAKYQLDEMTEIQEVGETTRPGRATMLKAFEGNFLEALDKAIAAKDAKAFDTAYAAAVDGCNACHTASSAANWKSYKYVKIQAPTADNNDYLTWKADKGTGSYIANPPAAATAAPAPVPTGTPSLAGVEKMVNDLFSKVDRTRALWNIQPGLGTVMIEYGRRLAQVKASLDAGNWDMAKYQLDEMVEIQEVGETTRPGRAPMLKAFEDSFLTPLNAAIMAQDKTKAAAALNAAQGGCNACHAASKAANWGSYAYVQINLTASDPADYVQWNAPKGAGNYLAPAAAGTPAAGQAPAATAAAPASAAAGAAPKIPASHAGRTQCLVCHATGAGGAPKPPASNPDHSAFKDDNNAAMCLTCHTMTK